MRKAHLILAGIALALAASAGALAQIAAPPAPATAPVDAQPAAAIAPLTLDTHTIALDQAFADLPAAKDRVFRMRKLELAPGARLPMQDHTAHPAIYYVAQGVVQEHRQGQAEPMERQTGDSVLASAEIVNAWENTGARPVTLLIAEVLPPGSAQ